MSTIIIYIFTNINKENKNQCKYPRPSERVKRPRCHGACLSLALLRLTSGAREAKSRGAWRQQIYIKRLKIQEINKHNEFSSLTIYHAMRISVLIKSFPTHEARVTVFTRTSGMAK